MRTRAAWQLAGVAGQFVLCLGMAMGMRPVPARADTDSRLSVVETRENQIDTHLGATDASVSKLWDTVETQRNDLSHLEGEGAGAFGVLTILTGMNLIVQVRKPKG